MLKGFLSDAPHEVGDAVSRRPGEQAGILLGTIIRSWGSS